MHITIWMVQLLLAATLVWAGVMKLTEPIPTLASMWPWAGQVPDALVRFTGLVDLLGATGLLLPALLRIQPRLTPIAAIGIVLLMVVASVFHIARGETTSIGFNIVVALLATFVAWGRLKKVPILSRRA